MPARTRQIGPEVSLRVRAVVIRERARLGWSRAKMSGEMAVLGYDMSAATIRSIEKGITERGHLRVRIVSVDEAAALAEALGVSLVFMLEE